MPINIINFKQKPLQTQLILDKKTLQTSLIWQFFEGIDIINFLNRGVSLLNGIAQYVTKMIKSKVEDFAFPIHLYSRMAEVRQYLKIYI